MPHQESLTILAEVLPEKFDPLGRFLGRISKPGAAWSVLPFAKLPRVHFARFILFEPMVDLDRKPVPAQLALETNVDAPLAEHLDELSTICGAGIDRVFEHCAGYPAAPTPESRRRFLKEHSVRASAEHINRRGRSVEQIRQEERLRQEINQFLDSRDFSALAPARIKKDIVEFVRGRDDLKWALKPAKPPALSWRIKEWLHLVAGIAIGIILLPLLLLGLPVFILLLRFHEKRDKPDTRGAEAAKVRAFRDDEDHWAHNQIVAAGFLKKGWFRQLTTAAILLVTDWSTRHIYNRGTLSGLNTIHFARWVRMNGKRGLYFSSNYDGSLEMYMNDFIDKAAWGLNAIFSNGDGFPRTCYMFCGGIMDEKAYKKLLPTRQAPSNVWYSAYPQLTTKNIANNEAIRAGLSRRMNDEQTRRWLRRFGCGNELPESNFVARLLDRVRWDQKCNCR